MSESSPLVIRQEEGRLFEALGAPVWRLVHPKTVGSSQLGMSICLMAPGDEIRRHSHDYEEAYFVLRGAGSMYVEGEPPIDLEPGVAVYVPSGRVHGQVADRGQPLDIILALTPPPVEGEPPRFADPRRERIGRHGRADRGEGALLARRDRPPHPDRQGRAFLLVLLVRRDPRHALLRRHAAAPGRARLARSRPLPVRQGPRRRRPLSPARRLGLLRQGRARRVHAARQSARRPSRHEPRAGHRLQLGLARACALGRARHDARRPRWPAASSTSSPCSATASCRRARCGRRRCRQRTIAPAG